MAIFKGQILNGLDDSCGAISIIEKTASGDGSFGLAVCCNTPILNLIALAIEGSLEISNTGEGGALHIDIV